MKTHVRIGSGRETSASAQPTSQSLVPRTCACGKLLGPSGECAECRAKRAGRAESADAAWAASTPADGGHDFGLVDVHRRPGRFVQRQEDAPAPAGEEEEIPLQPGELDDAATGGSQLATGDRVGLQSHFGADLSGVRVHADARAHGLCRQLTARAFTYGDHIFFRNGEYTPRTSDGRFLLAHEVSHVLQQRSGRASAADERRLEHEANNDARAAMVAPGDLAAPTFGSTGGHPKRVQRWRYATAADANPLPGAYVVVPPAHQSRVNAAMAILQRIVNERANFGACHTFFENNCPGGGANTLRDELASAIVWRRSAPPADMLASSVGGTHHIAYARAFPIGRWAVAASFVHELIHTCGQASHIIGDDAKAVCGRLPNI